MARVTVQDCLEKIPNRFELVLLATRRARHLLRTGIEALVPWENDKATVVALREIADGCITREELEKQDPEEEQLSSRLAREAISSQPFAATRTNTE